MAFLSNSKRFVTPSTSNNNYYNDQMRKDIGPGEYFINNTDIAKALSIEPHSHRPPFNASSERLENDKKNNYYNLLKSLSPGPGAYDIKGTSDLIGRQKDKSIGFMVKDERFKDIKNDVPGPNEYHMEKGNVFIKKKLKPLKIHIDREIPFKEEKTIGPGQYDIKTSWEKNMIDWKRMSSMEQQEKTNEVKTQENFEINYKKKSNMIKKKIHKTKESLLNQIAKKIYEKNEEENDLISQMKEKQNKEEERKKALMENKNPALDYIKRNYQYFDSTAPRFTDNKIEEEFPGPGAYEIKGRNTSPSVKISPPHKVIKKKYKIVPGMGNLVITSQGPRDIRKFDSFNNVYIYNSKGSLFPKEQKNFGRSEARFKNIDNYNNFPGPGTYLHNLDLIKPQMEKYNLRYKKRSQEEIEMNELKKIMQQESLSFPPVGSYNLDNNSIQGDLEKMNKYHSPLVVKEPKRFESFDKNNNPKIGPGAYYNELENKGNSCKGYKFSGSKSMDIYLKHVTKTQKGYDRNLGPGRYNLDSYFDWNKKSYNNQYV